MNELVSIIMPSYNTAKFIGATIESVLSQTYTDWELIIVDDCSTDNTDEIVATYLHDTRIHYYKNEKNNGAAFSRNRALRMAKGKWIAFLDSDDVWLKEKLEKQIVFMKENEYHFTYTYYRINLNERLQPYIVTGPMKVTKLKLYNYCYFFTSTVMYDREYIGLIQIADLKKNNDYAMWLKAIERSPCYCLPQCLAYYYKHDNSISSGNKIKLIKYHYILFRKGLDKSVLMSLVLTVNNLFWGVLKKIVYKRKI